ncbi:hypothetical protein K493DRAFT_355721 [Basidiobolus meristosporus CBS 931.73]|uniref:Uncharacterized protein n=1 Tax=Basidiobolus meristosporus CBS 931.73 TaxID=1314790 RepID=A0A1Y1Y110_9FUNG|nr:hypothetical protein K493DRAFT_355721 [Basidiobolus meristosporus CBS 931.73]|eukprot:ORX91314.1 hypothetical protein K493DRAFT_355721 [Basidiobolus meristosporus CBS 931.73]
MRVHASLYCMVFAMVAESTELATSSVYVLPLKSGLELEAPPFAIDISFKTLPVLFSGISQMLDINGDFIPDSIEEEYLWMNPIINSSVEEEIQGNLLLLVSGLTDGSEILPNYKPAVQVPDSPSPTEFHRLASDLAIASWEVFGGSWKTHYENRHGGRIDIRAENLFLNERMPSALVTDDEAYDYFMSTYQLTGADHFDPDVKEDMMFIREVEYTTRMIYRYSWMASDYPADSPNSLLISLSGLEFVSKRHGPTSVQANAAKMILHELIEKDAHDGRSTFSVITMPSDPLQIAFLDGVEPSPRLLTGERIRSIWDQYGVIGLTGLVLLASTLLARRNPAPASQKTQQPKPADDEYESTSEAHSEEELDRMSDSETDYEEEATKKPEDQ